MDTLDIDPDTGIDDFDDSVWAEAVNDNIFQLDSHLAGAGIPEIGASSHLYQGGNRSEMEEEVNPRESTLGYSHENQSGRNLDDFDSFFYLNTPFDHISLGNVLPALSTDQDEQKIARGEQLQPEEGAEKLPAVTPSSHIRSSTGTHDPTTSPSEFSEKDPGTTYKAAINPKEGTPPSSGSGCHRCERSSTQCLLTKKDSDKFDARLAEYSRGDTGKWTEWSMKRGWSNKFPSCSRCKKLGERCEFAELPRREVVGWEDSAYRSGGWQRADGSKRRR
ncbi:hypothetical protein V866_005581 [Kwoniella sp. B9012]